MSSNDNQGSSFALDSIDVTSCDYFQYYLQATSYIEYSCDFESNCNIVNDDIGIDPKTIVLGSIRSAGSVDDTNIGPRTSSGWGGEQFLYWFRSDETPTEAVNGQFRISTVETNREMCVRFAYFLNSTRNFPYTKNTNLDLHVMGCQNETIWSIENDDSVGWQSAIVKLNQTKTCSQTFYLRIRQKRGQKVAVAFDNIDIFQCEKLPILTTTTASTTTKKNNPSRAKPSTVIIADFILLFFNGILIRKLME